MKWMRLVAAVVLLAAVGAFFWLQFGQEIAFAFAMGLIAAFAAFSIVLDDNHAGWLARTRNVPVWGLWISVPVTLVLVIPLVLQTAGSIWAAVADLVTIQLCLPPAMSVVTLVCLILLYRRRPRRQRQADDENL